MSPYISGLIALFLVATEAAAQNTSSIPVKGGWSLQMQLGRNCPTGTKPCFTDQTGVYSEFNRTGVEGTFSRGEECCPFGTTPRLECGTYVNNGQPYACCPLGNADCRGDVEDPLRLGNEKCANPGWALWQIPDGGYNTFCCLPNQYGFWYKSLGQDSVGMCSVSSTLPDGSTPAVQLNNGDGSVSPDGTQLVDLPLQSPPPAPTCDVIHYGWSLQVNDERGCTDGSRLCNYGGACCPYGLNCGTVIGDSEVPVCCVPGNPDCRGDVEGLWPQLCADSSWALWHVNTNGNHFCCKPGQVGFNVPNDNAAVGFCGSRVPNGTMRSILDYEGDGSRPGAFAKFPCDSSPQPTDQLEEIKQVILNPSKILNPATTPDHTVVNVLAVETAKYMNLSIPTGLVGNGGVVATVIKPWMHTTYSCPPQSTETPKVIHSLSEDLPATNKFYGSSIMATTASIYHVGASAIGDETSPVENLGEVVSSSPIITKVALETSVSDEVYTSGLKKAANENNGLRFEMNSQKGDTSERSGVASELSPSSSAARANIAKQTGKVRTNSTNALPSGDIWFSATPTTILFTGVSTRISNSERSIYFFQNSAADLSVSPTRARTFLNMDSDVEAASSLVVATEFPRFKELSDEVILMIWKIVANTPRNICLSAKGPLDLRVVRGYDDDDAPRIEVVKFWSPTLPPPILHVYKVSRDVGLKYYSLSFDTSFEANMGTFMKPFLATLSFPPEVYVNWNVDRICIDREMEEFAEEPFIDACNDGGLRYLGILVSDHKYSSIDMIDVACIGEHISTLEEIAIIQWRLRPDVTYEDQHPLAIQKINMSNACDKARDLRMGVVNVMVVWGIGSLNHDSGIWLDNPPAKEHASMLCQYHPPWLWKIYHYQVLPSAHGSTINHASSDEYDGFNMTNFSCLQKPEMVPPQKL